MSQRIMSRQTADMLIRVASIYKAAVEAGAHPLPVVAERLGITRRAAAQRVYRARAAGLLTATSRGRATRLPERGS